MQTEQLWLQQKVICFDQTSIKAKVSQQLSFLHQFSQFIQQRILFIFKLLTYKCGNEIYFRTVVNGILAQVASNLKTSCEVTDAAFKKRINEVKEAKGKLEEQKSETIIKIQELESTLQSLEQAIMAKQGPLATCQAKIHQRRLRPGQEYCHDEVDDHLAIEQRHLLEIINKLEAGLGQV